MDGSNWATSQWYRGFFLLPLFTAIVGTGITWSLFKSRRSPATITWVWGLGFPLGFIFWLVLWHLLGPGTGAPEPSVAWISLIAWLGWFAGMYLLSMRRFLHIGAMICFSVLGLTVAFKLMIPTGTGLLLLNLVGAFGSLPYLLTALFHASTRDVVVTQGESATATPILSPS